MSFKFDIIEGKLESLLKVHITPEERKSLSKEDFYSQINQITKVFIEGLINKGYGYVKCWVEIEDGGTVYCHVTPHNKNDYIN